MTPLTPQSLDGARAAFLAGLSVGFWKDLEVITKLPVEERRFVPRMSRAQANAMRQRWIASTILLVWRSVTPPAQTLDTVP